MKSGLGWGSGGIRAVEVTEESLRRCSDASFTSSSDFFFSSAFDSLDGGADIGPVGGQLPG